MAVWNGPPDWRRASSDCGNGAAYFDRGDSTSCGTAAASGCNRVQSAGKPVVDPNRGGRDGRVGCYKILLAIRTGILTEFRAGLLTLSFFARAGRWALESPG